MDETSPEPDRSAAELAGAPLNWEVSQQEIESMSHEELLQEVVTLNEKTRRLYEVAMLTVHGEKTGQPVRVEDIDNILNPENIK